jgi:ABC-type uncharacterized transport system permease subunit
MTARVLEITMRLSIPAPLASPLQRVHRFVPLAAAESLFITLFALVISLVLFGLFVMFAGANPISVFHSMYVGSFGTSFSIQNTLARAAPLMLTGLCVALPLRLGMVIIGGEGALALGGLTAAVIGHAMDGTRPFIVIASMMIGAGIAGGIWITIAGALKQYRGVNETISSLLLAYTAIAVFKHVVEGPMRDPASLNKPSTRPLAEALQIGSLPGADIHWGLVFGIVACIALGLWLFFTSSGFATRVVGGNARAARLVGLPSTRIVIVACAVGGACAGLAGGIEVAAVHTSANASLIAGLGYAGILVSFVARHNPWIIMPVAVLFGGFGSAGSLLQRRLDVPDASVLVLQGFAFLLILASEALRGRLLTPRAEPVASPTRAPQPGPAEPVPQPVAALAEMAVPAPVSTEPVDRPVAA